MQKMYDLLLSTKLSILRNINDNGETGENQCLENASKIIEYVALLFNDISKGICRDKATKDLICQVTKYLQDEHKKYFEDNNCFRN
jgi:hypothetical protein